MGHSYTPPRVEEPRSTHESLNANPKVTRLARRFPSETSLPSQQQQVLLQAAARRCRTSRRSLYHQPTNVLDTGRFDTSLSGPYPTMSLRKVHRLIAGSVSVVGAPIEGKPCRGRILDALPAGVPHVCMPIRF